MSLQIKILLNKIKENWIWFFILSLLTILCLILYSVRGSRLTQFDLLSLICYPRLTNNTYMSMLISLYQIALNIYIIYIFVNYDFEYSFDNIVLRINNKKWILYKIVCSILFVLFFKLIQIILIYLFFYNKIDFKIIYLFYPLIYFILITLLTILVLSFAGKKKNIYFIILIIVEYTLYINFNFLISIIISIFLIIFTIYYFNLKKYCCKKNTF